MKNCGIIILFYIFLYDSICLICFLSAHVGLLFKLQLFKHLPWLHGASPPVTEPRTFRPVSRALQLFGASGHVPDSLWGQCHGDTSQVVSQIRSHIRNPRNRLRPVLALSFFSETPPRTTQPSPSCRRRQLLMMCYSVLLLADTLENLSKIHLQITHLEKKKSSEPNLQSVRFQPLIFQGPLSDSFVAVVAILCARTR